MSFTNHEWWGLIHGMGFGALFLLAFAGGLAGIYSLRPGLLTSAGLEERTRRLKVGVVTMAIAAWGTVITGTWIVYPWYRVKTPDSPRSKLLANPDTELWHQFGMEWKEHVAWLGGRALAGRLGGPAYVAQGQGIRDQAGADHRGRAHRARCTGYVSHVLRSLRAALIELFPRLLPA